MYPEVYDLLGRRIAILKDAYDVSIEYELNTWPTLKFSMPISSSQWVYLVAENRIQFGGEHFVIRSVGDKRDNSGAVTKAMSCPSIASELNYKYVQVIGSYIGLEGLDDWAPSTLYTVGTIAVYLSRAYRCVTEHTSGATFDSTKWVDANRTQELVPITANANYMMTLALANTGWSVGTIEIDGGLNRTFSGTWVTVTSLLVEIREKFDSVEAYLKFNTDDLTVDLLTTSGDTNGVTFQYGKNMLEVDRNTESDAFITRLYAYGDEDLTISGVNPTGQSYLDDFSYFTAMGYDIGDINADVALNGEASKFIKVGYMKFSDYIDDGALYDDALRKLNDELALPNITYRLSLVDLSELTGWEQESFAIGDTVNVVDEDLGINVSAKVVKMSVVDGQPDKTIVELSRATKYLGDILSDTINFGGVLKKSQGISDFLKRVINTFATTINSTNGKLIWTDSQLDAIEIDEAGEETGKRVRLSPGGIGISVDGGQTYVVAMTGDGLFAEHIIANSLHILQVGAEGIVIDDGTGVYQNPLLHDTPYNKVKINITDGFVAEKWSGETLLARMIANATYGIAIQKSDGAGGWIDQFWVDLDGVIHGKELILSSGKLMASGEIDTLIDLENRLIDFSQFTTITGRLVVKDELVIANSPTPGDETVRLDEDGLTVIGDNGEMLFDQYGMDPRFLDYFKNMVYNSSFELFDSVTMRPIFWTGDGVSDPNSNFHGSYSMRLDPGGIARQGSEAGVSSYINPTWYGRGRTRISFYAKSGQAKIEVFDTTNLRFFTLRDADGNEASSITFDSHANWNDSRNTISFDSDEAGGSPCTYFYIKITNVGGSACYIDAISCHPDFTGKWPQLYKEGPYSTSGASITLVGTGGTPLDISSVVDEHAGKMVWHEDGVHGFETVTPLASYDRMSLKYATSGHFYEMPVFVQTEDPTPAIAGDVWIDTDDYSRYDMVHLTNNYSDDISYEETLVFDTAGKSVTLPVTPTEGVIRIIKNASDGRCTIIGNIDGESEATKNIFPRESMFFLGDGNTWGMG